MFVVDDILALPFRGVVWLAEEIHQAAQEELGNEAEAITKELQGLYRSLEVGEITDEEFGYREADLLDKLDLVRDSGTFLEDDDETADL